MEATYISSNTFTVDGDRSIEFNQGRRIKATLSSGDVFCTISGSAYSGGTDKTAVGTYENELNATLESVLYGVVAPGSYGSLPDHTHDGSEGSGGTISGTGGGGTTDHSALSNLDYASAGHTGFASSTDITTLDTKIDTTSGTLQNQIDNIDITTFSGTSMHVDGDATVTGTMYAHIYDSYSPLTIKDGGVTVIEGDGAGNINFPEGTTGAGVSTFTELTDTPSGYDEDKYLKSTLSGTEWIKVPEIYFTDGQPESSLGEVADIAVDENSGIMYENTTTYTPATWNPLDKGGNIVLSNGNLSASTTAGSWQGFRATVGKSSGKWYWEIDITGANYVNTGVATSAASVGGYPGQDDYGCGWDRTWLQRTASSIFSRNASSPPNPGGGTISVALDMDNGEIYMALNGTWLFSGNPVTRQQPAFTFTPGGITLYPMVGLTQAGAVTAYFGASDFTYTVPDGYNSVYGEITGGDWEAKFTPSVLTLTGTPSNYDDGKYLRSTTSGTEWAEVDLITTFSGLSDTPDEYEDPVEQPDYDTKFLLQSEAGNGTSVFTDSSYSSHTYNTKQGDPVHSTAESKFGNSSIHFDGNDNVQFTGSSDLDFGSGDFTVDWWEYRTSTTAENSIASRSTSTNTACIWGYYLGNVVYVYLRSGTGGFDIAVNKVLSSPALMNQWVHYAVVRDGNTFYTFANGVQQDTWTSALAIRDQGTDNMVVGSYSNKYFAGYVEDFRMTKGVARWTSGFTPPTETINLNPGATGRRRVAAVTEANDAIEFVYLPTEFTHLEDTPTTYSGADGKFLTVSGSELVFTDAPTASGGGSSEHDHTTFSGTAMHVDGDATVTGTMYAHVYDSYSPLTIKDGGVTVVTGDGAGNIDFPVGATVSGAVLQDGADGADGATWTSYSGIPASGTGNINDLHLDTSTYDIYQNVYLGVITYGSNLCTGGTAEADSEYGAGYEAELAFDGSTASYGWNSTNTALPHWVGYALPVAKAVSKVRTYAYAAYTFSDWKVQGSNSTDVDWDDKSWTDLHTVSWGTPTAQWYEYTFSNTTEYKYYRMYITAGNNEVAVPELEFYEQLSGDDRPTTFSGIGNIKGADGQDATASGGGASTFLDLTDTPTTYSGGGYLISTASGIEYGPGPDMVESDFKAYEVVAEVDFNDEAVDTTISGINGDTDDVLFVEWDIVGGTGATSAHLQIELNGDSSTNYPYKRNFNRSTNTTPEAASLTAQPGIELGWVEEDSESSGQAHIFLKSGRRRSFNGHENRHNSQSNTVFNSIVAGEWTNTADEVNSITLKSTIDSGVNKLIGRARIYKFKKVNIPVEPPTLVESTFKAYEEVAVYNLSSETLDVTISGVNGDTDDTWRIEYDMRPVSDTSLNLYASFNNDDSAGTNYSESYYGVTQASPTTMTASYNDTSSYNGGAFAWSDGTTDSGFNVGYADLFLKSGRQRIIASYSKYPKGAAHWTMFEKTTRWTNTADEVTKIRLRSTTSFTGTVRVYRLKKVALPSVTTEANLYRGKQSIKVQYATASGINCLPGNVEIDGTLYNIASTINKSTSGLSNSTQYYVYVDPPATGIFLAAADIEYSTTAPTYNETDMGAYNGSKRCIGAFRTDGSGNILEFYVYGRRVMFETVFGTGSTATPSNTWTDSTFGVPLWGGDEIPIIATFYLAWDGSAATYTAVWRKNGRTGSGSNIGIIRNSGARDWKERDVIGDSNGTIEYRYSASSSAELYCYTQGYILPDYIYTGV
jgi:hypothetical protein